MTDELVLYDPKPVYQLDGTALGPVSCTCVSGVVATDRNTQGQTILDWHAVRKATGDFSGGTTVNQVDDAIEKLIGDDNLSTGYWLWKDVDNLIATEGKGFLIAMHYQKVHDYGVQQLKQGVAQDDLISGQENGFTGWHAQVWHEWLEPGQSRKIDGKTLTAPADERLLISFDPLCDGRRPTVAKGPVGYPESLVKAIVADSQLGGSGRLYGAVTLDARYVVHTDPTPTTPKPKRTLKFGGKPIHRKLITIKPANIRSTPRVSKTDPKSNVVRWLAKGSKFTAYQVTESGGAVHGNRKWYGNRGGDLWVSATRIDK